MRALMYALILVAAAVVASVAEAAAAPKPSWVCISGVCLGNSRDSLDYRFGIEAEDIPSRHLRVSGGRVLACFWRCANMVTEDGFTHYGGTMRPSNNVLNVSTCDRIARLPDGAFIGKRIPFGKRWNGYHQVRGEGMVFAWEKRVTVGPQRVTVNLVMNQGRVICIGLQRV